MNKQLEYMIGLSAVYLNGRRDYFTVRHVDSDSESARYSVWHKFKSFQDNMEIECLVTNIV